VRRRIALLIAGIIGQESSQAIVSFS